MDVGADAGTTAIIQSSYTIIGQKVNEATTAKFEEHNYKNITNSLMSKRKLYVALLW